MHKKYLIFFDIDGTLIKPNQKPNTSRLPDVIKQLGKQGMVFGLNSNRAEQDLLPIYDKFVLNGPMVLENGVYFLKNKKAAKRFIIQEPPALKRHSITAIKKFIKQNNLDCVFRVGDTVKEITSTQLKQISLGIFLNGFRLYTGSIHIFRYGRRDRSLANKLAVFLRQYFDQHKIKVKVEVPKAFGNIVFWPRSASKGKAFSRIKKYYPGYKLVMVGDDLADLDTLRYIDYFFAVANAQPEVRKKADYTAKKGYTQGVIEVLKYIEKM